jgi:hypothetical protein
MTLRLRRGTDLQRQGLVLAEGELVYVTDTKEIYAGDGSTLGGIKVTGDVLGSPPRLTQNLDLDGYNIAGIGTISATAFIGDGSQLTGIASSGGGVIEGQEYQIDIVGDVKASNSTVLVDSSTSSFFGNFVGDGSLLSDLELNQNTDVNILLPTDGDILQYTGGIWVNTPLTINIVEGTDYRFNIIGDDSTKIVDTATGNVTGNFIGDGSLITNLELNQNTDVNILLPAEGEILKYIGGSWSNAPDTEGIIEGGNYKINIVGLDSTTIVDVANNEITIEKLNTASQFFDISYNVPAQSTNVKIKSEDSQSIFKVARTSTTTDLSIDDTIYGSIYFEREDTNGPDTPTIIAGGSDRLIFAVDDGTNTFPNSNVVVLNKLGFVGFGTYSPTTKLDIVDGSLRFNESRTIASITSPVTGEMTFNIGTDSLSFYDGSEWRQLISSSTLSNVTDTPGALVLGEVTDAEKIAFGEDSVDVTGAVIYNSTTNRFEFFQAGSWVTLHNNGTSAGQVLTWDGAKWEATAPATGGSVVSADQLDGFDGPYYLNWNNFTNTPSTLAGYGIIDAALATDLGNFTFTGSVLDTDDSSSITVTPAVTFSSDVTVQNSLTVTNKITVDTLEVSNLITAPTAGTPEISSDGAILLTAATRVEISSSPLKMASFTTAERDVLSAENGDMIYNTSTNKFQGYANGIWVDLH